MFWILFRVAVSLRGHHAGKRVAVAVARGVFFETVLARKSVACEKERTRLPTSFLRSASARPSISLRRRVDGGTQTLADVSEHFYLQEESAHNANRFYLSPFLTAV